LPAGLHAGTILLLALWTLWLFAALPLLGLERGGLGLLAVFVLLALILALRTGVTGRGYLVAWLAAHAVLAVIVASQEEDGRQRQLLAAVVSLGGLCWLWAEGGWQYGRVIATATAVLAAAGVLGLGCRLLTVRWQRKRADEVAFAC
jgi:hypothetical protein